MYIFIETLYIYFDIYFTKWNNDSELEVPMSKYTTLIERVKPDSLSLAIDNLNINFQSCGHWFVKHKRKVDGKTLPYYRLAYIVKGHVDYKYNGEHYTLTEGDVLLTRPNTLYEVDVLDDKTEFLFIYFSLSTAYLEQGFLEMINYNQSPIVYKCIDKPIYYLFSRILEEFDDRKPGYYLMCQNLFKAICVHINRFQHNHSTFTTETSIDNVGKILLSATVFIQKNIYNKLTIEMIANHVNVSPNYLFKIFKSKLKVSPSSYITQIKIGLAQNLLLNSDYSIMEVASMLGFSSSQHFSQVFKKNLEVTPKDFRKDNKLM